MKISRFNVLILCHVVCKWVPGLVPGVTKHTSNAYNEEFGSLPTSTETPVVFMYSCILYCCIVFFVVRDASIVHLSMSDKYVCDLGCGGITEA